jgi:hypothetical protein
MLSAGPDPPIGSNEIVHATSSRSAAGPRALLPNSAGDLPTIMTNGAYRWHQCVVSAFALLSLTPRSATAPTTTSAAHQLAEQYAPIAEIRR